MSFTYLLEKIANQPFSTFPFKHIEIFDFFSPEDFAIITQSPEVHIANVTSDQELIGKLRDNGYEPIYFPGTTENVQAYLDWHAGKGKHTNLETCEGYGMTYRLMSFKTPLLAELNTFFNSPEFLNCVADKFGVELAKTYPDNGLQKYLDGYEISPHPDIRKKALTYMININYAQNSEDINYHTHYMTFNPNMHYVQDYWTHNETADRCWVPWSWCKTEKRQTANNSIVIFSPTNDTIHAVRAKYDHLQTQRTQYYGNLWFKEVPAMTKPIWSDFVITPASTQKVQPLKTRLKKMMGGR